MDGLFLDALAPCQLEGHVASCQQTVAVVTCVGAVSTVLLCLLLWCDCCGRAATRGESTDDSFVERLAHCVLTLLVTYIPQKVLGRVVRWLDDRLPCRMLRRLAKCFESDASSIDKWVLGTAASSIAVFCLTPVLKPMAPWVLPLGLWRVYGIVVHLARVILLDAGRKSRKRSLILAVINYVEIVFWFAFAYRTTSCLYDPCGLDLTGAFDALYFSLATMSLLGASDVKPQHNLGWILLLLQMAIGLFLTMVVLARLVGLPEKREVEPTTGSGVK